MKNNKQKIVPNLWFDNQAEEAVNFYTSIFENSGVNISSRYPEAGQEIHQQKTGSIMTIDFHLSGYNMLALNGGPHFKFNSSISFFAICKDEEETNRIWNQLLEGGEALMLLDSYEWSPKYGWPQDRYGLNWQLMLETGETSAQKIIALLFFTGEKHRKAEEAVRFYASVFDNSSFQGILKYAEEDENEYARGAVKHIQFQLEGETFMAMDSGIENNFPFNEAISFIVKCENQVEIDLYWEKLTTGGDSRAQQCGWLKDKFGVFWQVVPVGMEEILNHPDKEKANRAMEAMLKMKKINLDRLQNVSTN